MIRVLFQLYCGLRTKHHFVQQVDNLNRRIWLSCLHCGKEWKGSAVELSGQPRKRFDGDPARHRMSGLPRVM